MSRKIISLVLSICFLFQQTGLVQAAAVELNLSGYFARMASSMAVDSFRPIHLRYFSYDSLNNSFKLLLDKGTNPKQIEQKLKEEAKELLKYFLIGVTLPNDKFWVNLRPDSPKQIIDFNLEETDIGKIMLEADLQLKKDTANFTSPQTPEGKEYWNKLYKKAEEIYGTENITIPTLTRPWIVPNEIIVRETKDSAYVYKATLKVMLEQDYLKDSTTYNFKDQRAKALNEYSSQLIRELIIPKLTKEVNLSKRYAPLRQVYYSLILSRWFKSRFQQVANRHACSLQKGTDPGFISLIDKNDLTNLTSKDTWDKNTYFQAYKKSFTEGEYNIKEPVYTPSGQVIRSYFSGGMDLTGQAASPMVLNGPRFTVGNDLAEILSKRGWLSAGAKVAIGKPINITFTSMGAASPVQSMKERVQELESDIEGWKRDVAELYKEINRNDEEIARLSRGSERKGTYLWSTPTNPFFTRELPNPTPKTDNLERINQNWYNQIELRNKEISAARSELGGLKNKIAQAISALGDLHVTIYQQKSKNLVSFQLSTKEKSSNAEALSFIHDFTKEEVQKITKAYQDESISNARVPELSKIDTHVTLVFDYPYSTTSNFLHAESLTGAIAEKIHEDWRKWKQANSAGAASPVKVGDVFEWGRYSLEVLRFADSKRAEIRVEAPNDKFGEQFKKTVVILVKELEKAIYRYETHEKTMSMPSATPQNEFDIFATSFREKFTVWPRQYSGGLSTQSASQGKEGASSPIGFSDSEDAGIIGIAAALAATFMLTTGIDIKVQRDQRQFNETTRNMVYALKTLYDREAPQLQDLVGVISQYDFAHKESMEDPRIAEFIQKHLRIFEGNSDFEGTKGIKTRGIVYIGKEKQKIIIAESYDRHTNQYAVNFVDTKIMQYNRNSRDYRIYGDNGYLIIRLTPVNDPERPKVKYIFDIQFMPTEELSGSPGAASPVTEGSTVTKVRFEYQKGVMIEVQKNVGEEIAYIICSNSSEPEKTIRTVIKQHAKLDASDVAEAIRERLTREKIVLDSASDIAKLPGIIAQLFLFQDSRAVKEKQPRSSSPVLQILQGLGTRILNSKANHSNLGGQNYFNTEKVNEEVGEALKDLSDRERELALSYIKITPANPYNYSNPEYLSTVEIDLKKAKIELERENRTSKTPGAASPEAASSAVETQEEGIIRRNLDRMQPGEARDALLQLQQELSQNRGEPNFSIEAWARKARTVLIREGLLNPEVTSATSSPVGGIDFKHKALASATTYEAMGSFSGLDFSLPKLSSSVLLSFNLDKEQADISRAIDNGIIVSGQRIKEFMAASSVKGQLEQRRETVITWLAKLGILEETTCCTQESSREYREALVIADSA